MKTKSLQEAYTYIRTSFPSISKIDTYELIEKLTKYKADDIVLKPTSRVSILFNLKFWLISFKIKSNTPIAYITKNKNFCGLKMYVNSNVLIPRPESEFIVEYANEFIKNKRNIKVLDLCSGSGCLGIAVLKQKSENIHSVTFSDISKKALKVCKKNLKKINLLKKSHLVVGNFLEPFLADSDFDLIMCNPPYISYDDQNLEKSALDFEPKIALFTDQDGLWFYEQLFSSLDKITKSRKEFMIVLEFGWQQKDKIEALIKNKQNFIYEFKKDYSNNWRNLIITNKEV